MKRFFEQIKSNLKTRLDKLGLGRYIDNKKNDEQAWIALVNEAHKDWNTALNNFNFFSEEDLVDYSIFSINAAEKRYMYLIRKARELNVIAERFPVGMAGGTRKLI